MKGPNESWQRTRYIGRTDDTAAHARAGVARRLAQLVAAEAEVILVLKRAKIKR